MVLKRTLAASICRPLTVKSLIQKKEIASCKTKNSNTTKKAKFSTELQHQLSFLCCSAMVLDIPHNKSVGG